jgi:ribosomal protein S18
MEAAVPAEAKAVRRDERENTARGSKGERKRREETLAKASAKDTEYNNARALESFIREL